MTGVLAESVLLLDRAGSTNVLLRILFQGPGGSGPSPDPAHRTPGTFLAASRCPSPIQKSYDYSILSGLMVVF